MSMIINRSIVHVVHFKVVNLLLFVSAVIDHVYRDAYAKVFECFQFL